ncbi:MAG: phage major capsid protein [Mycobacterium sp.]
MHNFTRERRAEVIAGAKAILATAKAEGRGITAAERKTIDSNLAEAKSINHYLTEETKDQGLMGQLNAMALGVSAGPRSTIDDGKRLSFGKSMATAVASKMLGGPDGSAKALAPSGAAVVGLEFNENPVALGRVATSLLNGLPVIQHDSPRFQFLRQGIAGRTNNAAIVADGAVKPTSPLGVELVDNLLDVVAHLSELIPRYWLADNVALERFVSDELQFGLSLAIEAMVIADLNSQSGIQTQAFTTSALMTIRKSLTKLEAAGLVAGAIVLHPTAWEGVELALASTNAVEHMALPYDPASRRLYGVPVVVTISEAPLVAHVLAADAVALDTDTFGIDVRWSENSTADSFSRNQIQNRCEGRFATSVYRPFGVVKAALA